MFDNLFFIAIVSSLYSGIILSLFGNKIGLNKVYITFFFFLTLSLISVCYQLLCLIHTNAATHTKILDLLDYNGYIIPLSFSIDLLTMYMMFVVLFISTVVCLFSMWYMKGDPNQLKFLNYLNFFMFFMFLLATSDSLVIMFIGWEGIGLFSYLLINFWNSRLSANRSGLKAILVNKVGDVCLYFFLGIFYAVFEIFSDKTVKISNEILLSKKYMIFNLDFASLLFISLFIAGIAKSAQFILHVWLPDAMEGPTPVSALLHAATMVTAGAFLIIKYNWITALNDDFLHFIALVGVLTNFISSLTALFQNDMKKIIAYSTASQMGLIFIGIGLGKPVIAFYHLFNHAFFKALLFILAGIIIHIIKDKQDSRLIKSIKSEYFFLYSSFLISLLTLSGAPFLSAYYSKEAIIHSAYFNLNITPFYILVFLFISVVTTVMYSLKVYNYIFISNSSVINLKVFYFASDKKIFSLKNFVLLICYVLSIFSIFSGFIFNNVFYDEFIYFVGYCSNNLDIQKAYLTTSKEYIAFELLAFFILLGIIFENFRTIKNGCFNNKSEKLSKFFSMKFLFDHTYYFLYKLAFSTKNIVKEEKNFLEAYFKKVILDKLKSTKYIGFWFNFDSDFIFFCIYMVFVNLILFSSYNLVNLFFIVALICIFCKW